MTRARALTALVVLVVLAAVFGCASSETPRLAASTSRVPGEVQPNVTRANGYSEALRANFVAGCADVETTETGTTLTNSDLCECAYDYFASHIPYTGFEAIDQAMTKANAGGEFDPRAFELLGQAHTACSTTPGSG